MTDTPKTVRVRIAVGVNHGGDWFSQGWSGAKDEALKEILLAQVVHFIEADIPLPTAQTIEGKVVE